MKRIVSLLLTVLFALLSAVSACAEESSFILAESTLPELGCDKLVYMPEQKIYHFTEKTEASIEIPVAAAIYAQVILGGYKSASNGVTDNGVNCVCSIKTTFFDENGEELLIGSGAELVIVPADGTFHCCNIGSMDMYAGIPDNVSKVKITVSAENDTAYLKSLVIASSDTKARNMSAWSWEHNPVGNINAQTSRADYFIMIGFVFAAALIMFAVKKARDRIKKGK